MCDHHFWYNLENVTGSLIGKKELVFLLLYLHSHVSKDINGKQITFHEKISINRVNAYTENNVILGREKNLSPFEKFYKVNISFCKFLKVLQKSLHRFTIK